MTQLMSRACWVNLRCCTLLCSITYLCHFGTVHSTYSYYTYIRVVGNQESHLYNFVHLISTAMVPPTAVRSVRVKGSSACTNNDPIDDVTEQHGDQQEPCPTRHNYDGGRAPYFSQQEIKILLDLVEIRLPSSSRNWAEIAWALYMLYPNNKVMRCGDACRRKFLNLCNTK